MKLQKLLLSVVTTYLLVGAAGETWAIDCDEIIDDEIVGDVTVGAGASCIINKSNVRGDIVADGVNVVIVSASNVDGHVLINNSGVVVVQNNDLWDGRLVIRRSDQVAVIDNNVEGRRLAQH